ncbi:MAG TPA: uroporphyrinogen-III synthase, partial [Acidimicrobiia bacterium]|nr:uroporphyrinogen-III synthase [Acidimicrobiia bacterium]
RAEATPVAAVRWGTRPEQRTVYATLGTINEVMIEAPSVVVIGDVAALDLAWFERRPLFGRSIVVTRAREQASELRDRLEALGAEVIELPVIGFDAIDFAMPDFSAYAWVIFTSANGVDAIFDRGIDARSLAGTRIAAIGPGTAAALTRRSIQPDLVPERFVAESLLDAFAPGAGDRVLLARAETARDVLPDGLAAKGYAVDVLAVYRTVTRTPDPAAIERVRSGGIDAVTFASSSTVHNFCDAVGALDAQPLVISIGPVTSQTARERGLRVDAEADPHTIDGLVAALLTTLGSLER